MSAFGNGGYGSWGGDEVVRQLIALLESVGYPPEEIDRLRKVESGHIFTDEDEDDLP